MNTADWLVVVAAIHILGWFAVTVSLYDPDERTWKRWVSMFAWELHTIWGIVLYWYDYVRTFGERRTYKQHNAYMARTHFEGDEE